MSSLFDDLCTGLQEAIEYEQGNGTAKKTVYIIEPVKRYSRVEIKKIRVTAGMTQTVFAEYMGVSKKTVEAWERGTTHPTGSACRLIDILSSNSNYHPPFISYKTM